mmetsp:Transcript_19654/g.67483  ORF Transcript_19654/g.67483 Transcript_19654/m.67483 type:complete len:292 (-) Transcript_19654:265-1140(-)
MRRRRVDHGAAPRRAPSCDHCLCGGGARIGLCVHRQRDFPTRHHRLGQQRGEAARRLRGDLCLELVRRERRDAFDVVDDGERRVRHGPRVHLALRRRRRDLFGQSAGFPELCDDGREEFGPVRGLEQGEPRRGARRRAGGVDGVLLQALPRRLVGARHRLCACSLGLDAVLLRQPSICPLALQTPSRLVRRRRRRHGQQLGSFLLRRRRPAPHRGHRDHRDRRCGVVVERRDRTLVEGQRGARAAYRLAALFRVSRDVSSVQLERRCNRGHEVVPVRRPARFRRLGRRRPG